MSGPWALRVALADQHYREGTQELGLFHWVPAGSVAAGNADGPCSPGPMVQVRQANTRGVRPGKQVPTDAPEVNAEGRGGGHRCSLFDRSMPHLFWI